MKYDSNLCFIILLPLHRRLILSTSFFILQIFRNIQKDSEMENGVSEIPPY